MHQFYQLFFMSSVKITISNLFGPGRILVILLTFYFQISKKMICSVESFFWMTFKLST